MNTMKHKLFTFLILLISGHGIGIASPKVYVKEARLPVILDRQDNVIFYVKVISDERAVFNELELAFDGRTDLSVIDNVKLYYSGTEGYKEITEERFAPVKYISSIVPGQTREANPSYSVLLALSQPKMKMILSENRKMFPGVNYFWVSLKIKEDAPLDTKIGVKINRIKIADQNCIIHRVSPPDIVHRVGVGLRQAGDDGSISYRIPGLATTNEGTLLAVYDVRYNGGKDLQEHIDIGLSRSTDGGQTWERMRLPLAFGEYDGLPSAQNGVGDPSILVDAKTNTVWIAALWSWGMGNTRNWTNSRDGNGVEETSQLVLAKSTDDGKTWSKPINITSMVKDPSWKLLLQGPGRGISMTDGTLVFPIQYKDIRDMPQAGIMYSKDRGETWTITNPARTNTTEAQVAELPDGSLMLNMRDNRGGSRAVSTTKDLGRTWEEHPSSRTLLREPVCQASLISVKAKDNVLGQNLLIFSNPDVPEAPRSRITIKLSLDDGNTWPVEQQLLLDEDASAGYSCLTMIDAETVGILYEGSAALLTFQTVKLRDLVIAEDACADLGCYGNEIVNTPRIDRLADGGVRFGGQLSRCSFPCTK